VTYQPGIKVKGMIPAQHSSAYLAYFAECQPQQSMNKRMSKTALMSSACAATGYRKKKNSSDVMLPCLKEI
jgi:hypothetical protein